MDSSMLFKLFKFNSKKKEMKSFVIVYFVQILIGLGLLVGEGMCIYKAITCDWEPIGKAEVLYTGAALTGLGSIVGYFDIEDTKPKKERDGE